jgi:hypothetical protein
LIRALSEAGNPELRSLTRILDASGLEFKVVPKRRDGRRRGHSRGKAGPGASRGAERGARY